MFRDRTAEAVESNCRLDQSQELAVHSPYRACLRDAVTKSVAADPIVDSKPSRDAVMVRNHCITTV